MSKEKQEQEADSANLLGDFNWDTEDSFFGIGSKPDKTELEKIVDEVEDNTQNEEQEKQDKESKDKEEEQEEDLFSDNSKIEIKKEEESEEDDFYSTLASEMKEKNIFQFATLPVDGKITEQKFFELQDEEVEARTEQAIQDFIAEMTDQDGGNFIKHKRAGGSTKSFFDFYKTATEVPEVDTETEAGQQKIIIHYLKTVQQLDDDEIQEQLDWLKDGGKQKKFAEKYNEKLSVQKEESKKQFLANQVTQQTDREEAKKLFVGTLKSTIDQTEKSHGFVFPRNDKADLLDYITKPAVKLNGNQYLTRFQSEMGRIIKEDPEKLMILAKLLKTDFDTSDMQVGKETEAARKIKSNLENKRSKLSSTVKAKNNSLADYFN